MAISELYITRHLLQETVEESGRLIWRDKDSRGYWAERNGIRIELVSVPSNIGSRVFLTFSEGFHKAHIAEPLDRGLLGSRYDSEDERELAYQMKQLWTAAQEQCVRREIANRQRSSAIREAIFHRLLFGDRQSAEVEAEEPRPRSHRLT